MGEAYLPLQPDEVALLASQLDLLGEGKLPWTRPNAAVMVRRLVETVRVVEAGRLEGNDQIALRDNLIRKLTGERDALAGVVGDLREWAEELLPRQSFVEGPEHRARRSAAQEVRAILDAAREGPAEGGETE